MSMPVNSSTQNGDSRLASTIKVTSLNPNAAEFVPSSLRSTSGGSNVSDATKKDTHSFPLKTILDRSESSKSNNSDDEAHQFWRKQLPDDIIPDFTSIMTDEQESGQLTLDGLLLNDNTVSSLEPASQGLLMVHQGSPSQGNEGQARYEDDSQSNLLYGPLISWEQKFMSHLHSTNGKDELHYARDSTSSYADISSDFVDVGDGVVNPLAYLVSQFPNFSAESLADLYYANGCNFNMTVEILSELEMQADGSSHHNLNMSSPTPNFSTVDFPSLSSPKDQNGLLKDNVEHLSMNGRKASLTGVGATDFVSAVRRASAQNTGLWKFEKKSSQPSSASASGVLSRQYGASLRSSSAFANSLQIGGTARAAPVWLETGEAVANMYSESREEARDLARVRNAYFEQARQAYLIGNKALAKELSAKGQMYNIQMKAAHEKAKEAIYRQRCFTSIHRSRYLVGLLCLVELFFFFACCRNPAGEGGGGGSLQGYGQKQDRLIDLHGLHVNEALQILKHELTTLRNTARSMGERVRVMICVGTGHHTRLRTARLPVAVEQFLLDEGLHFMQPQPGLLQVVLY